MRLFTVGFTKTTAECFFTRLRDAGVKRVVDVRLNNVSQLAGFAKRSDLPYFLRELANVEYIHMRELAPTQDLLDAYKKHGDSWSQYEASFRALMYMRQINLTGVVALRDSDCLLCSEAGEVHCHRRIVAEIAHDHLGFDRIEHL